MFISSTKNRRSQWESLYVNSSTSESGSGRLLLLLRSLLPPLLPPLLLPAAAALLLPGLLVLGWLLTGGCRELGLPADTTASVAVVRYGLPVCQRAICSA
jgi:hypothetical protein